MAQQLSFQTVTIHHDNCLGKGSYGAVYTATCDELLCAAKVLHTVFFETCDASRRFVQECEILGKLTHPNIVQYLGTTPDPESGNPVLLMELMDESLGSFLERSSLPFHLAVSFSHDISLALVYLHSHDIIHRDLSSNNILLIAGSRAKVTDFGMARWVEGSALSVQMTKCPGCPAYMPPEALLTPPRYSDKLDCFSAGVLVIQMITRKFPNPGTSVELIEDARSEVGYVQVPRPESERRKADIGLIDPNHFLLPIAQQCLKFRETDRPSAKELCQTLAAIKKTTRYSQSLKNAKSPNPAEPPKQVEASPHGTSTSRSGSSVAELDLEEGHKREEELQSELRTIHSKYTADTQLLREENEMLKGNISSLEKKLSKWKNHVYQLKARHDTEKQELYDRHAYLEQQLRKQESQLTEAQNQAHVEREKLRSSDRIYTQIADLRRELSEKKQEVKRLQQRLVLREPTSNTTEAQTAPATSQSPFNFYWLPTSKAPEAMERGTAVVDGNKCYFAATFSTMVHEYDANEDEWNTFSECPHLSFTLAVVNGQLTTVGGIRKRDKKRTNVLLSLSDGQNWLDILPPMPTERSCAAVISTQEWLIVAGGEANDTLSTIEVMSTETEEWFTTVSLPEPHYLLSATVSRGRICLLGEGKGSRSVHTCPLSALLQSCEKPQAGKRKSLLPWQKLPDLPVAYSTCATINEQLIALGGIDDKQNESDNIYMFDDQSSSWRVVGHMPTGKYRSLVAVLPSNKLVTVGGLTKTHSTDTVDIALVT